MSVHCTRCGEELLGAVNRCWHCGQSFADQPDQGGIPPVRRPPLPVVRRADELPSDEGDAPPVGGMRVGSPFAPVAELADRTAVSATRVSRTKPAAPRYPGNTAAEGAAVASLVLGFMGASAALLGFFPLGALSVAILGMVLGIWGLYSRRRGWSLAGVVLCCLALTVSGFHGVVQLYTKIHGHSPFENPLEEDDF